MIPVIVESPYAGNIRKNLRYVRACMHDCLVNHHEAPFASHAIYTQDGVLDDTIPAQRSYGIDAGLVWGKLAQKTVVYENCGLSSGMKYGIKAAEKANRPIEFRRLPENWDSWKSRLSRNFKALLSSCRNMKRRMRQAWTFEPTSQSVSASLQATALSLLPAST